MKDYQQVSELTKASTIYLFELCGYDITTFTETKIAKKSWWLCHPILVKTDTQIDRHVPSHHYAEGQDFKGFFDTFHFTTFALLSPFVKDYQQVSELTKASSNYLFYLCGYDITTFTETKNCKNSWLLCHPILVKTDTQIERHVPSLKYTDSKNFKAFFDTFHFATFASLTQFVKDYQQVSELTKASSIYLFELCGYDITTFTETKNCKKIVITLPLYFGKDTQIDRHVPSHQYAEGRDF